MTQVRYELRPMKSDQPLVTFEDRKTAISWAHARNQRLAQPVPLRLVTVQVITLESEERV